MISNQLSALDARPGIDPRRTAFRGAPLSSNSLSPVVFSPNMPFGAARYARPESRRVESQPSVTALPSVHFP